MTPMCRVADRPDPRSFGRSECALIDDFIDRSIDRSRSVSSIDEIIDQLTHRSIDRANHGVIDRS